MSRVLSYFTSLYTDPDMDDSLRRLLYGQKAIVDAIAHRNKRNAYIHEFIDGVNSLHSTMQEFDRKEEQKKKKKKAVISVYNLRNRTT